MTIIEITPLENGAHLNQTINGVTTADFPIPEGYALVPDGMETPNFPFGDVTVQNIDDLPTVTSWTPLPVPEPSPEPEPGPTMEDIVKTMLGG